MDSQIEALQAAQVFLRALGCAPDADTAHDIIVNQIEDIEDTVSAALKDATTHMGALQEIARLSPGFGITETTARLKAAVAIASAALAKGQSC